MNLILCWHFRNDELELDFASPEYWTRVPCDYCCDYARTIPFQVVIDISLTLFRLELKFCFAGTRDTSVLRSL
jgi:hypothetical protein